MDVARDAAGREAGADTSPRGDVPILRSRFETWGLHRPD